MPRLTLCLTLVLLFTACTGERKQAAPPSLTGVPGKAATALDVVQAYLGAWRDGRYGDMYDLLAPAAQQAIARERFVGRYGAIAEEATIQSVAFEVRGGSDPNSSPVPFTAVFTTGLWGEIRDANALPLTQTVDGWRVEWAPSLIFSRLTGANLVRTSVDVPKRGAILDRGGRPLAVTGAVPTVGTSKNLINVPQFVADREGFIKYLAQRLGMMPDEIKKKVDDPKVDADLFIPLKTLPASTPDAVVQELENTPGVLIQRTARRVYPHGTAAAHVIGYIAPITAEQLEKLRGEGYGPDDLVGATGLEAAYERELAGHRGARLTIITPEGALAHELAKRPVRPAQDVITGLSIDAQLAAERALGERTGSLVVLDPRDNSVVAMASHPSFDPNLFVSGLGEEGARLLNDPRRPLLNRAVNASYPPGSTFKVISGAAGLERGGYSASSRFPCPPVWRGLGPSFPKNNWNKSDEGALTVAEGLMRSCNPVFYDIAVKLDGIDPNLLPEQAAGWGFGKPTGVNGIAEDAGINPTPKWKRENIGEEWFTGDSVNLSIGQGFLLATPLQVANAYSAMARGGVLRTPLLVKELRESGSEQVIKKEEVRELGRLPVSAATLNVIRQGTTMVIQDARGTAYSVFRGSTIDAAGKSGTAEDRGVQSHALFAAYAPRNDAKGVAVVVLDEGESGSLEAGPMTRQVLEAWLRVAG